MLHPQPGDPALQGLGKTVMGCIHVGKGCIAAFAGNLQRVEQARLGWLVEIRHVGVPNGFAGAEAPDRHAIDDDVGHDVQFGMSGHNALAVLLDRRMV